MKMKWYSAEVKWLNTVARDDVIHFNDYVVIEGTERYLGEFDQYITTEEDVGKIIYCKIDPKP